MGLSKFFESKKAPNGEPIKFNEEDLSALIAEITEREVARIVEANAGKIKAWVPSQEDKERTEALDELEKRLIEDQKRYEEENKRREEAKKSGSAPRDDQENLPQT